MKVLISQPYGAQQKANNPNISKVTDVLLTSPVCNEDYAVVDVSVGIYVSRINNKML